MKILNRLKMLKIFLQLVRDPNRTDLIFKAVEIVSQDPNHQPVKLIEEHVLSDTTFREMYEENYVPAMPEMKQLKELPEDSFGFALYQHMKKNNLGFEIFPRLDCKRPVHYLSTRIYQDHDLWHTLLGYGIEVEDELAIQAFGVAQYRSPIGTMLISGGLLHLLGKDPIRAVKALDKVYEGYEKGRKTKFLPSVRLHDFFARPLSEVRELCRTN